MTRLQFAYVFTGEIAVNMLLLRANRQIGVYIQVYIDDIHDDLFLLRVVRSEVLIHDQACSCGTSSQAVVSHGKGAGHRLVFVILLERALHIVLIRRTVRGKADTLTADVPGLDIDDIDSLGDSTGLIASNLCRDHMGTCVHHGVAGVEDNAALAVVGHFPGNAAGNLCSLIRYAQITEHIPVGAVIGENILTVL